MNIKKKMKLSILFIIITALFSSFVWGAVGDITIDPLTSEITNTADTFTLKVTADLGADKSSNLDLYINYDPTKLTVSIQDITSLLPADWSSGEDFWVTSIVNGQIRFKRNKFIMGTDITGPSDIAEITFNVVNHVTGNVFEINIDEKSIIYNAKSENIISNIIPSVNNPATVTITAGAPTDCVLEEDYTGPVEGTCSEPCGDGLKTMTYTKEAGNLCVGEEMVIENIVCKIKECDNDLDKIDLLKARISRVLDPEYVSTDPNVIDDYEYANDDSLNIVGQIAKALKDYFK